MLSLASITSTTPNWFVDFASAAGVTVTFCTRFPFSVRTTWLGVSDRSLGSVRMYDFPGKDPPAASVSFTGPPEARIGTAVSAAAIAAIAGASASQHRLLTAAPLPRTRACGPHGRGLVA